MMNFVNQGEEAEERRELGLGGTGGIGISGGKNTNNDYAFQPYAGAGKFDIKLILI